LSFHEQQRAYMIISYRHIVNRNKWKLTVEQLVNKFTQLWVFHPVPSHFNPLLSHPQHFFINPPSINFLLCLIFANVMLCSVLSVCVWVTACAKVNTSTVWFQIRITFVDTVVWNNSLSINRLDRLTTDSSFNWLTTVPMKQYTHMAEQCCRTSVPVKH
jgi:hypothetical protein